MTPPSFRSGRLPLICMTLLCPIVLASCRVTSQAIARTQKAQDYRRLEIIYQAHPETGAMFSSPTGIIQASARVSDDPFQNMTWSKAELRIECPHPDGRADMARLTLHYRPVQCGCECDRKSWGKTMEERSGTRQSARAAFRERWFYDPAGLELNERITQLDLPKAELDAVLAELDSHGFFAEHSRSPESESHLEVRLDRHWTSRRWGYEPSLDALTTRVYQEGIMRAANSAPSAKAPHKNSFTWAKPFGRSQ